MKWLWDRHLLSTLTSRQRSRHRRMGPWRIAALSVLGLSLVEGAWRVLLTALPNLTTTSLKIGDAVRAVNEGVPYAEVELALDVLAADLRVGASWAKGLKEDDDGLA